MCKTTNWWFIIICNCIYIVVIVAGGWMGRWAVLGIVTEGGDWVVRTSHLYRSHKDLWKTQLLYADCVHFTVDWLFWKIYGSYIAPRPLLSWKNWKNVSLKTTGNFSFDNMGPLTPQKACLSYFALDMAAVAAHLNAGPEKPSWYSNRVFLNIWHTMNKIPQISLKTTNVTFIKDTIVLEQRGLSRGHSAGLRQSSVQKTPYL